MGQPKLPELDEFDSVFGDELEAGHTLMHGQYTIEEFLNAGGFGITYRARDSLDRIVVIKECFPGSLCRRTTTSIQARSRAHTTELSSIVRLFVEEARSLARLDHPNIVGVHQVFEENNTAYMALDFVEGRDLLDIIEKPEDVLEPEEVETMLRKLLDAVGFIHDQGILHRDISPDNVLLQPNMDPILIDFGAAREEAGKQSRILSAMRVVKDGYSPQEFYISGAEQGQFSDLYALGATFYHLITGDLPANSQTRLAAVAAGEPDPYIPVADRMPAYSENFLQGIDKALEVLPKDRIASATHWLNMLDGKAELNVTAQAPAAKKPQTKAKAEKAQGIGSNTLLLGTAAVLVPILVGFAYTQLSGSNSGSDATAIAAPAQPAETTAAASTSSDADVLAMLTTPVEGGTGNADDALEALLAAPAETAPSADVTNENADFLAVLEAPDAPDLSSDDALTAILTAPIEAPVVETTDVAPAADITVEVPAESADVTVEVPAESADVTVEVPAEIVTALAVEDAVVPASDIATPIYASDDRFVAMPLPADLVAQLSAASVEVQPTVEVAAIEVVAAPEPEAVPAGLEWMNLTPAAAPTDVRPTLETFDLPKIVSGWSVDVESKLQNPTDTIFGVNGLPVDGATQIDTVMRENFAVPASGETQITVLAGSNVDSAVYTSLTVPVVHRTTFENGLVFEARMIDGTWTTNVATTAPGLGLQEGDILVGDMATGDLLDARTSLPDLLVEANASDRSALTLAIRRGNEVFPVDVSIPR